MFPPVPSESEEESEEEESEEEESEEEESEEEESEEEESEEEESEEEESEEEESEEEESEEEESEEEEHPSVSQTRVRARQSAYFESQYKFPLNTCPRKAIGFRKLEHDLRRHMRPGPQDDG